MLVLNSKVGKGFRRSYTYFSEAEKESDRASYEECIVNGVFQLWKAKRTGASIFGSIRTADFGDNVAGWMIISSSRVETAAIEGCLNFCLDIIRNFIPSFFSKDSLLMLINSQARAGNGKLNNEEAEEDDHVEEQSDLMVLCRPIQSTQS